jgi:hypothetical protein
VNSGFEDELLEKTEVRFGGNLQRQNILPSAFAPTVYIQFSLIILFLVIHSRAIGSTWMNHGDGQIGINSVKD